METTVTRVTCKGMIFERVYSSEFEKSIESDRINVCDQYRRISDVDGTSKETWSHGQILELLAK